MSQSNFANLKDGIAVVFLADFNSEFYKCQQKFLETTNLNNTQSSLWLNLQDSIPEDILEIIKEAKELTSRKKMDEVIIWVKIENGIAQYLTHKLNPEKKYNWITVSNQFEANNSLENADDENLWAWGQVIKESGEYLCRDCGYIETFEVGKIFPVCEVCLAGDPEGPLEVTAGFWEKI